MNFTNNMVGVLVLLPYTFEVQHQRKSLGPVVRVSPNEVSICDIRAAREIYNTSSRFYKSNWYRLLVPLFSRTLSPPPTLLFILPVDVCSRRHFQIHP